VSEVIDPTRSTSAELNRRAFMGLSVAATAGAAVTAQALAADLELGKTHTPLVAEDDPAIVVQHVKLDRPGGSIDAYAASPKNATASTPSLVVVMHIWGVDTSIRDVVRRYAKAGYNAIAPDLYARFGAPSGDGVTDIDLFRPAYKQLDRTQYDGDISAAHAWLKQKAPQGNVGVTGFCMGGHVVLIQALDNGALFSAAAPFYGDVKEIDPLKIQIPICGSYGARDKSIPADDVRAFASKLAVPHDIKIYDEAGHAFFDDQRGAYVASAADDAWTRVLAFFKTHIGGPA
jgi:carboxymethylenebutenolidase